MEKTQQMEKTHQMEKFNLTTSVSVGVKNDSPMVRTDIEDVLDKTTDFSKLVLNEETNEIEEGKIMDDDNYEITNEDTESNDTSGNTGSSYEEPSYTEPSYTEPSYEESTSNDTNESTDTSSEELSEKEAEETLAEHNKTLAEEQECKDEDEAFEENIEELKEEDDVFENEVLENTRKELKGIGAEVSIIDSIKEFILASVAAIAVQFKLFKKKLIEKLK